MSNRAQVLSMIHKIIANINKAGSREQRVNLLEKAQILAGILVILRPGPGGRV